MKRTQRFFAATIVLLAITGAFFACKAPLPVEPEFFYTALVRRASLMDDYPNGVFQFGFMASEKDGGLLVENNFANRISAVSVTAPNGEVFTMDPYAQFNLADPSAWQGYFVMGAELKQIAWVVADPRYNAQNPPPEGEYVLSLTDQDGTVNTRATNFAMGGSMEGFPQNLQYHQDGRLLMWDAVPGTEVYYRVYVLEGKPEGDDWQIDWSRMIYASVPTGVGENFHEIPAFVEFKSGKDYLLLVEAIDLPFFHVQDAVDQLFTFTAN